MENRISIPKPCHENWDNMLPEEQGRHCLSCCKTVIDFSTWDNESILAYLQNKNGERTCGRFKADQLEQAPAPKEMLIQEVLHSGMPILRKIAAVIVICFGLLQANDTRAQKVVGKIAVVQPDTTYNHTKGEIAILPADTNFNKPVIKDTTKFEPMIMGMIAPPKKDPKPVKKMIHPKSGKAK